MRKPSLFERLTGSISPESYDDLFEDETSEQHAVATETPRRASALLHDDEEDVHDSQPIHMTDPREHSMLEEMEEEAAQEGELAVDVYQTADAIVVKALIAGVNPNSVDISLTRDMITVRGHREEHKEATGDNYFYKELYWGGFTRTILLPEEVDVDAAEASTDHGILIVRLPKVNKERKTKLRVKTGVR